MLFELCYLRFVAAFGTESRYCKMPVDSLAAAHGWHTGPSYASTPGGTNLLCDPFQAWDTLPKRGFAGHTGASPRWEPGAARTSASCAVQSVHRWGRQVPPDAASGRGSRGGDGWSSAARTLGEEGAGSPPLRRYRGRHKQKTSSRADVWEGSKAHGSTSARLRQPRKQLSEERGEKKRFTNDLHAA